MVPIIWEDPPQDISLTVSGVFSSPRCRNNQFKHNSYTHTELTLHFSLKSANSTNKCFLGKSLRQSILAGSIDRRCNRRGWLARDIRRNSDVSNNVLRDLPSTNSLIHGLVAHRLHNDTVVLQGLDTEAGNLYLLSNKLLGSAQLVDDRIFGR